MKNQLLSLFALVLAFTLSNHAFAFSQTDRALLNKTQISLTQAVAIATAEVPGTAYEVDLDSIRRLPVFEVSIATENQAFEVTVDAIDGRIIKVELE